MYAGGRRQLEKRLVEVMEGVDVLNVPVKAEPKRDTRLVKFRGLLSDGRALLSKFFKGKQCVILLASLCNLQYNVQLYVRRIRTSGGAIY
jgi:hypothetical protein